MRLIKNTGSDRVIDELRQTLAPSSSLDLASPAFSLFAFAELREVLEKLDACRVVLPETNTPPARPPLPHKCPVRDITAALPSPEPPAQPSNVPPPLLYTVKELAQVLRVSRATLDRLQACGVLPGKVKIGHQVRYVRHIVEAWLTHMLEFRQDGNQTQHGRSNQPSGPVHGPNL